MAHLADKAKRIQTLIVSKTVLLAGAVLLGLLAPTPLLAAQGNGGAENTDSLLTAGADALLAVATGAYDLPQVDCRRAKAGVTVDGRLSEPAWENAPPMRFFDVVSGGPALCGETEAKLLWDDDCLYVGVRALDRNVWSTLKNRDDPLCSEEVIEVFIDPDGDLKRYIEIEVNPLNAVFDLAHDTTKPSGQRQDARWNCEGLQTAVRIEGSINQPDDTDTAWTLEMAIPWKALTRLPEATRVPPAPGDTWRLNLYRYERPRGPAQAQKPVEHSAWSPTRQVNFHLPERFGKLAFRAREEREDADAVDAKRDAGLSRPRSPDRTRGGPR